MDAIVRRLSWGGLQKRSVPSDDEDVEVVEFFSAATTSETTEKESVDAVMPPTKKQRKEERESMMSSGHATLTQTSETVVDGDVSLLTPPTKRRRMLAQSITAMETLIEVIADEEEVLSTRLEYCSNLWRFVREMQSQDVVEFVRQRGSSIVRVIEALLHTGYFPLQQLCFMTVAAILYQLHKKDADVLAAFVVACKQYLSAADVDLLELLPLRESIPWHDPRVARQRIVQINRRTGLCNSFRASRCWVSPSGKQELARIRVNKWIDIGSTTTTFYWRDESDFVVVNVPHSCVEDVEIDKENCVLYIWTKHIERLKGVRLLAFATVPEDFPGLVKALVGVEIEGYMEPAYFPSLSPIEIGSPFQTMKTTSSLTLTGVSPPRSPSTSVDESARSHIAEDSSVREGSHPVDTHASVQEALAVEERHFNEEAHHVVEVEMEQESHEIGECTFEQDNGYEPDNVDKDVLEHEENSGGSDEETPESQPSGDAESASSIEGELEARLAQVNQSGSESLDALHKRLDATKESLTDKFARVSSARIEASDEIADRVYKLRARVDILQKKRLLDLPNAEAAVEDKIAHAATEATERMEEGLDYAAENIVPDGPDFVFTATSVVLLLVFVIPWVLFAALHSGTDLDSVRQLAGDAMVLMTAILRKLSG